MPLHIITFSYLENWMVAKQFNPDLHMGNQGYV